MTALGVKIGDDTLTVIGHTVKANGAVIGVGKDQTHGDKTVSVTYRDTAKPRTMVTITSGDYILSFKSLKDPRSASGYIESMKIVAANQTTAGYCANACGASTGTVIQSIPRQGGPQLFSNVEMSTLMSECGGASIMSESVVCGDKPEACNVCIANDISCDE